jgi:hypothetical protein
MRASLSLSSGVSLVLYGMNASSLSFLVIPVLCVGLRGMLDWNDKGVSRYAPLRLKSHA